MFDDDHEPAGLTEKTGDVVLGLLGLVLLGMIGIGMFIAMCVLTQLF